jgi:outer membrane immunogenic protein
VRNCISSTLLSAAGFVILTASSYAADAAGPAAAGFNWSGIYIGAGAGAGAVNHQIGLGPLSFNGIGGEGIFGELTFGYDHMLTDRLLLGGFIDVHMGNIGPQLEIGPLLEVKFANSYGFDAAARLGYLWNESTLAYVLGGFTWQHFRLDVSTPGAGFSADADRSGYILGVGMETVVGSNWTIKGEYRYANYGDEAIDGTGGILTLEPSTHTFHIGANYRFNSDATGPAIASPAYDWTGFYVGGALGAGEVVHDISFLGVIGFNGIGGEGVFGELSAGYDHDFGNFVAGIMADGNISGISTDLDLSGFGNLVDVKADYGFNILGRIGVKVNAATLAYALGGYSWAHFKAEANPALGGGSLDWSGSGFSIGGGLETVVSSKMTAGIEYRYSHFEKEDFGTAGAIEVEPSFHTVRLGLKYKFN